MFLLAASSRRILFGPLRSRPSAIIRCIPRHFSSVASTTSGDTTNQAESDDVSDLFAAAVSEISKDPQMSKEAAEGKLAESFESFGIDKRIINSLAAHGIKQFYPIQLATFEHIKSGHDIIAKARISLISFLMFLMLLSD